LYKKPIRGAGEHAAVGLGGDAVDAAGSDNNLIDVAVPLEFDAVEDVPVVFQFLFQQIRNQCLGLSAAEVFDPFLRHLVDVARRSAPHDVKHRR
jgi:hypothetical protein